MKIKTDFVTNSSSTIYVVFVPQNWYADEKQIEVIYEQQIAHRFDPLSDEQLYKETFELIEIIKEGDNICVEGVGYNHFELIQTILELNGLQLFTKDLDHEGNTMIHGVKEEVMKQIFLNTLDLEKELNFLKKEPEDVTEISKTG